MQEEEKKKKKKEKKQEKTLHEILTPTEKTEHRIFVNRDVNACKNILLLGKTFLINRTRPKEFTRGEKAEPTDNKRNVPIEESNNKRQKKSAV